MAAVGQHNKDPNQTSGNPTLNQQSELDPISQFQHLVPLLQESLLNLVKTSALIFHQNAQSDACIKSIEPQPQHVQKCLEDFYAKCDQLELQLRLAVECSTQSGDSSKNTPVQVAGRQPQLKADGTPMEQQTPQSYAQYLNTVKAQISCAKEIHDSLMECASKITSTGSTHAATTPSQTPPGGTTPSSMPQQQTGMQPPQQQHGMMSAQQGGMQSQPGMQQQAPSSAMSQQGGMSAPQGVMSGQSMGQQQHMMQQGGMQSQPPGMMGGPQQGINTQNMPPTMGQPGSMGPQMPQGMPPQGMGQQGSMGPQMGHMGGMGHPGMGQSQQGQGMGPQSGYGQMQMPPM